MRNIWSGVQMPRRNKNAGPCEAREYAGFNYVKLLESLKGEIRGIRRSK